VLQATYRQRSTGAKKAFVEAVRAVVDRNLGAIADTATLIVHLLALVHHTVVYPCKWMLHRRMYGQG
jgi:hypothetical protein